MTTTIQYKQTAEFAIQLDIVSCQTKNSCLGNFANCKRDELWNHVYYWLIVLIFFSAVGSSLAPGQAAPIQASPRLGSSPQPVKSPTNDLPNFRVKKV